MWNAEIQNTKPTECELCELTETKTSFVLRFQYLCTLVNNMCIESLACLLSFTELTFYHSTHLLF